MACPVCGSTGTGTGDHEIDWDYEQDGAGRHVATHGKVWFNVADFSCMVCGLELEDELQVAAAGLPVRWLVPGADPNDFDPGFDEDLAYEAWRDERRESYDEDWEPDEDYLRGR